MARGQWAKRDIQNAETHRRLLDAALEEFEEHGFLRARVDRIARRAELSRGAFYGHFSSLSSVAVELLEMASERERAELDAVQLSTLRLDDFLAGLALREEERSQAPPALGLTFIAELLLVSARDAATSERMVGIFSKRHAMFTELIAQLARTESIELADTPERIAHYLLATELGFSLTRRGLPADDSIPRFVEEILPGPFMFGVVKGPAAAPMPPGEDA